MHLNNKYTISFMFLFSFLTFFLGPYISNTFMKYDDVVGFLLGFTISIIIWTKFGEKFTKY